MRKNYKITSVLTILFLAISVTLSAQMSDQQVVQEMQRLEEAGMSQQQIFIELNRRGVPTSQLQRIHDRQDITGIDDLIEFHRHEGFRDDTNMPVITEQVPVINPEDRVFGQQFFARGNNFAPNINMPTPPNYVLGAGDEIIIDMWGHSIMNISQTIAPDGHIIISDVDGRNLGRVQLSGLTVEQARGVIKNRLATIHSDLVSYNPGTFMAISLGNVRTIRVSVMGEVVNPSTFVLSSFATVFHALEVAGGPNRIGSLRNIHVSRDGRRIATIDLYEYLMNGDSSGDISLRDGDIVMVDPHGTLVQIIGEVRRPMWYEMRDNETLDDLIRFAGGFSANAFQANLSLHRRGTIEMEAFTLNEHEFATFHLQDGDQVAVGEILSQFANMVEIIGAVYRSGVYAIGGDVRTVRDLVNIAQGPTGDAFTHRVQLRRQQEDLRQTLKAFDLIELMLGRIPDIELQPNDRLFIPSIFSLEDDITIFVGGEVRSPGNFRFAENMHLEDAILRAGGLTDAASTAQVNVFRRLREPAAAAAAAAVGEVFSLSLRDGEMVLSDTIFVLQPFDQVFVRRSPTYQEQQMITIQGEATFAGQYAKITRDERISSLVERAGGLTEFAFLGGARLYRYMTEAERSRTRMAIEIAARVIGDEDISWIDELDFSRRPVGINLARALQNPGSNDDIILQEGDILHIPINPGTVEIAGGVLFPNVVVFNERMNVNAYIRQAGGFSRLAMRNRVYVVHLNGTVSTGRWATVTPGSLIVVPERPPREPMSLQNWVGMSTSLATVALLISNVLR